MSLCSKWGAGLVLGALPLSVVGADTESVAAPSIFSFSGFGTAGETHSSEESADFTNNIFKPNGAGYTRSWSAAVDSLIGGQISARITPDLSAVVQAIAEQNYNGTYTPHVEWANIRYQFTPDFSIRIGRFELPNFLFSDTRNVGFTHPWVRPPIEVYSLIPATVSDGAGLSYSMAFGELTDTAQSSLVQDNAQQVDNRGTLRARDSFNIANTAEYKSLTVRASYQHVRLNIASIDGLLNEFKLFGPQGAALARKYNSDNKPAVTEALGVSYDPSDLFLIGEWAHVNFDSFLGDSTAWYASGGYRVGNFTPYVTYAHSSAGVSSDPGVSLTNLPPAAAGFAAALNAGLNAVLQGNAAQHTISLGVRWDFVRNVDLKAQFDHTRIGADSDGNLINLQPGFQPGGTVNLFSATVDFVF